MIMNRKRFTNNLKKLIFIPLLSFFSGIFLSFTYAAPSFDNNFLTPMQEWWDGILKMDNVSPNDDILTNLQHILYPGANTPTLWIIQDIALLLIIAVIAFEWAKLLIKGKNGEDITWSLKNIWYIALGGVFVWWASWLFSSVFLMPNTTTLDTFTKQITDGKWSLWFEILSLLKTWAFFFAIIMMVYTGFKVVHAWDWEKGKTIAKWIINILVAIIIIKGVDYIYSIAASENFIQELTDLIKKVAKICGYLYGAAATLLVIFAWYSLVTDNGSWEGMKKAKNRLINLAVSWLVLFWFFLIVYQIFSEFQ